MHIEYVDLRRLCPSGDPAILAGIVQHAPELLPRYGIDRPIRWCHVVAQIATETGGLRRLEENLSYSAQRLIEVWPSRFPTLASAEPYARQPERLANNVYANRMGNGASHTGDGWLYRGRGCKMLTGLANYQAAQRDLGLPLLTQPDLAMQFPETLEIACWYWRSRKLNQYADVDDLDMVTRAVNGGLIGIEDRSAYLTKAKTIWGVGADHIVDANKMVRPTLRLGSVGAAVVTLQRALNRLQHDQRYPLAEDGAFGPRTEVALIAWQGAARITADGIAGPATWASLDAADGAPTAPAPPPAIDTPDPPDPEPMPFASPQPAASGGFFHAVAAALRRWFA